MNDFSDLFYTIFSIVIFSFLLLQANSLLLRNDTVMVDHEYEKTAISSAQSIIDEAKRLAFDQNMDPRDKPDSFSETSDFGNPTNLRRDEFTVFDQFDEYEETILTQLGEFQINVLVDYVEVEDVGGVTVVSTPTGPTSFNKRMTVTAISTVSDGTATLTYIKSYF